MLLRHNSPVWMRTSDCYLEYKYKLSKTLSTNLTNSFLTLRLDSTVARPAAIQTTSTQLQLESPKPIPRSQTSFNNSFVFFFCGEVYWARVPQRTSSSSSWNSIPTTPTSAPPLPSHPSPRQMSVLDPVVTYPYSEKIYIVLWFWHFFGQKKLS